VQSSIYGDDPNPKVTEFNKRYAEVTGAPPSSQYVYPGYVLIEVWAKAVQAAGSTDTAAVTAQLEKMKDEPTLFGPRTFTSEIPPSEPGALSDRRQPRRASPASLTSGPYPTRSRSPIS